MEFRVTGIEEIASDVVGRDKIVLSLENVPSENEARTTGRYNPVARLTATVPYDSEFYNAVIGMRVSFGVPSTNNPFTDADAPPTVFACVAARRVVPNPNFGKPRQFFSYNLEPKAGEAPLTIAPDAPSQSVWDGSGRHYKHGQAPVGTPPELIDPPNLGWLKDKINQTSKDTSVVYILPPHVGSTVQFPSGAVVTDPGLSGNTTWSDATVGLNETWTKTAADLQRTVKAQDAELLKAVQASDEHFTGSGFNASEQAHGDAERANTEMKKALPIILELMNNPTLVNTLGYKIDAAEILKVLKSQPTQQWSSGPVPAFVSPGYKFFDKPKQSELVEASTKSEEPVEPHYMVDYKKYPASYVEGLVRADVQRKAKLEFDLEIQKQMGKVAAEIDRARIEFAKSDKVDPRFKLWKNNANPDGHHIK